MLLIGSSNQPDSFSAKFRWVGRVCSWQCSPFRALFSVLNSPRNRRKSTQNGIPQPQKEYETTPQGLLTNEFQPLNEVAKNDPRSAIRAAWSIAEREIRQLAIENGARGTEVSSNKRVLKWLEESKTISHSIVSMASELYELRSKIVYYPQDIVRQEQATEYLKLAESLVRYLRSLEEQTSPR